MGDGLLGWPGLMHESSKALQADLDSGRNSSDVTIVNSSARYSKLWESDPPTGGL